MSATIKKMKSGFRKFRRIYFKESPELFEHLKTAQKPQTLVIACSDSRVDPAILMQVEPGDIFVIRNVANLVPPYEPDSAYHGVSAAIEYAVCTLQVKHIVILGHSNCGGIAALMNDDCGCESEFLNHWLELAYPAKENVMKNSLLSSREEQVSACEKSSIILSVEHLMTFPWIAERVRDGLLDIQPWYFDIKDGTLYEGNISDGTFTPVG